MPSRRTVLLRLATVLGAALIVIVPALGAELTGTVKSVDVDAKKIVVTPKEGDKDIDVTVNPGTAVENAKGKVMKKFSLERLKVGGTIDVTHENGVASKIVLKKGAVKKKGE